MGPWAKMSLRRCAAVIAVAGCAAVAVPSAVAGSASRDLNAALKDFRADDDITACLFTKKQLENVKRQLTADVNAYSPELRAEVKRELKRWTAGGCSGRAARGGLRIVTAKGDGGVRRESVTLGNTGSKPLDLRGYALRDRAGKKIRFTSSKLAKGATLRVISGCAKGRRKPSRQGSRYYACKKKDFWQDTGDVAELLRPGGGVLARRPT